MKRSKHILFVIAGVLFAFNITSASALTEQSEVDVQFTFNPFLTMTLSSADIIIPNLAPGTSANSNTVNIVVNTNNVSGYNLSATVGNTTKDTRNLVHTNGTNTFSSIDVGTSATTLTTDNTWGYSIDAGSHYSGLPIYSATNGAELKNTSTPATDDTTAFLIGAKAATSQVAGDYTNVINFVAVTNAIPEPVHTIADGGNMQDVSSAAEGGCPSTLPEGQAYTLTDSRDGESYKVARLADGNCWLLDNLRLDLTNETVRNALTASNTNATEASLTSVRSGNRSAGAQYASSGFEIWDSSHTSNPYNQAKANADYKDTPAPVTYGSGSGKIGVYYNYCAASAGSYCYDSAPDDTNASQDICPAGWRMPTGGIGGEDQALYDKYNTTQDATNIASLQYNLSTPLSGLFYNGSALNQGSDGKFWSSTRYDGSCMYYLYVNSSGVGLQFVDLRLFGNSVRCLLQ